MVRHFEQDLQNLRSTLIKMGSIAEASIERAIEAVLTQNTELAQSVIDDDNQINSYEIVIDNAIIDLLALQQPVATDLRLILAAAKINNDLERIGDHAVNLAESAINLSNKELPPAPLEDITAMCTLTRKMLADALDSFIHVDAVMGESVVLLDDTIDDFNRKLSRDLLDIMKGDPDLIEQSLELVRVSKNLERVADLTTNIAEEVVFVAKAKVIKHHASSLDFGGPAS